jgi:hypothetical protein
LPDVSQQHQRYQVGERISPERALGVDEAADTRTGQVDEDVAVL